MQNIRIQRHDGAQCHTGTGMNLNWKGSKIVDNITGKKLRITAIHSLMKLR